MNGTPTWFWFTTGVFDFQCKHDLVATTPSGVAGLDLTFVAVGYTPSGLQVSNLSTVQFQ